MKKYNGDQLIYSLKYIFGRISTQELDIYSIKKIQTKFSNGNE
jgi:hypothetical protein